MAASKPQAGLVTREQLNVVREQVDHPIVDADGHLLEHLPLLAEYIRDVAGEDVARELIESQKQAAPHVGATKSEPSGRFPQRTASTG